MLDGPRMKELRRWWFQTTAADSWTVFHRRFKRFPKLLPRSMISSKCSWMEAYDEVATLLRPSRWVPERCSLAAPMLTGWRRGAWREFGSRWRFCVPMLNAPYAYSVV